MTTWLLDMVPLAHFSHYTNGINIIHLVEIDIIIWPFKILQCKLWYRNTKRMKSLMYLYVNILLFICFDHLYSPLILCFRVFSTPRALAAIFLSTVGLNPDFVFFLHSLNLCLYCPAYQGCYMEQGIPQDQSHVSSYLGKEI